MNVKQNPAPSLNRIKRIGSFILFALALFFISGAWAQANCNDTTSKSSDKWEYVGSKKCKMCHLKQYKTWKETRMAQSFEILKPGARAEAKKKAGFDPDKDYTTDKTCLPCHTTGYGKPGGFVSIEKTPAMAGVGCEVCHGPGKGYLAKGFMTFQNKDFKLDDLKAVGLVLPDSSTCTTLCHNEKNPFNKPFNWEERKVKGTHEHIPLKYNHG
jgi:hypothetical protein